MATASVRGVFGMSADELWALIGDVGDVPRWSGRGADSCRVEGDGIRMHRTLLLDDGGEVVDRLDAIGDHSFTYSIVTSPLPFRLFEAT